MNKQFFLLLMLTVAFSAQAQTRLIAHKSHSGFSENYSSSDFGNFGNWEPPVILTKVEKINDTASVTTSNVLGREIIDTLYYHPLFSDPAMTNDSLTKLYQNEVEFKNFEKKKAAAEAPKARNQQKTPAKTPAGQQKKKAEPVSKSKKGWLLLLLIGGGTFLGGGFIMNALRKRKAVPQYA